MTRRSRRAAPLAAALALLFAMPADAQPISQSMAECAALYTVTAGHMENRPANARKLVRAAGIWTGAAEAEAAAEGRADPQRYVETHTGRKAADWEREGKLWMLSEDFRDWAAYCRALARDRRIDLGIG